MKPMAIRHMKYGVTAQNVKRFSTVFQVSWASRLLTTRPRPMYWSIGAVWQPAQFELAHSRARSPPWHHVTLHLRARLATRILLGRFLMTMIAGLELVVG
jgi:hypothetical protein